MFFALRTNIRFLNKSLYYDPRKKGLENYEGWEVLMNSKKLLFLLTFLLVALASSMCFANVVYYVASNGDDANAGTKNSAWRTIGKAISVADGVTATEVRVSKGTYNENIVLKSNMTLTGGWKKNFKSRYKKAYKTKINGGNVGRVVVIDYVKNVTIDGFRIWNGLNSTGDGGGIFIRTLDNAELNTIAILSCQVRNSYALRRGAGIYIEVYGPQTLVKIHKTKVLYNTTSCTCIAEVDATEGAGIYAKAANAGTISIQNCTISKNNKTNNAWGKGGGVYAVASNYGFIGIYSSSMSKNFRGTSGTKHGAGVYGVIETSTSVVQVKNSILWGNEHDSDKGDLEVIGNPLITGPLNKLVSEYNDIGADALANCFYTDRQATPSLRTITTLKTSTTSSSARPLEIQGTTQKTLRTMISMKTIARTALLTVEAMNSDCF